MNTSEHINNFIQEMNRRNYAKNTIDNYVSCLNVFFSKSSKDHPKNINEADIKNFLSQFKNEIEPKSIDNEKIKLWLFLQDYWKDILKISCNIMNNFLYL